MQIIVGTLITTISILIIGLLIWHNHFYMIRFGRGLPEALIHHRFIATVIQSAPFIVFIYQVFRNPIFKNNRKKETPVRKKWSLAQITIAFVCVCILWPWPSAVLISGYFYLTQGSMAACSKMKNDFQNTEAAISSFYSVPDNLTPPSVEQLIEEEGLSLNYSVTIRGDLEKDIVITVINDSDKCPKGQKLVGLLGGGKLEWKE